MSERLPNGWVKTTLGEITTPSRARALPAEIPDVRYVGLEHIEPQTMRLLGYGHARDVRSSSVRFSQGDVLYGKMRPYLNKVWVAEFDGICSAEFLVFPKRDGLNSLFLALRLNAEDFVTFANGQVSGERPRVDFEALSRFLVLLPPATEQERIVAKLKSAVARSERALAATHRAQKRLTHYRAAVLHTAVTGELTRDWRNANKPTETALQLLKRLSKIRRARWEKSELTHLRVVGKPPKDAKWKSRYPEPSLPRTKNLPSLPKGWIWASLDQIGELNRGKSKHRPRDDARLYGGPYPFIQTGDIRKSGGTIREHTQTYSEFGLKQSRLWPSGTLCITIAANIAETGILSFPALFPDSVVGFVQDNAFLKVRFVEFFIRSEKSELERYAPATAQKNINLELLAGLAIPLPPFAEQVEIVREVERRLSAADRLSATLNRQLVRARAMRQSLLQEAFTGHLLPQNPKDENASVLLDHIHVARKTETEAWKKAKKSRGNSQIRNNEETITMNQPTPTADALRIAWQKIGKKPDALELFKAAGFTPEQVVEFYEVLRATPEVHAAFETASKAKSRASKVVKATPTDEQKTQGRFRLVKLWLENFKNLKNYEVHFDSSYGSSVVLGWNGTGKSNLFEALVIIFRDLHLWLEKNHWPDEPMAGYSLIYEIEEHMLEVIWNPAQMKRPTVTRAAIPKQKGDQPKVEAIKREELPLPRFVFGYYSGPTNRLAEHFLPMKRDHYDRLYKASADDPQTLAALLEKRRFFCAETHHAKYVLLAFSYKEDRKISDFLERRLRILGFESALFVIREPRWAKKGSTAENFWGASGIMLRVMEKLRDFAIAPMVLEQTVSDGYRTRTEDHYFFFLPDLKRLHAFAAEYEDARSFFLALESTDFSELIHDVRIQVRVKAANNEQLPITFRQLSEGEQQLLMVLGLMRFTKSHQSLILLDEPDTHLNPHWSVDYLKDLASVISDDEKPSPEQQTSQLLMATHDPLVIASLLKGQVHLLKRDRETLKCYWEQAGENPRGLGYTGILISDMFGFRSDLDEETLALLDRQVQLAVKASKLSSTEKNELAMLNKQIDGLGFKTVSSDPYYRAFIEALSRHQEVLALIQKPVQTSQERDRIRQTADEILTKLAQKHPLLK